MSNYCIYCSFVCENIQYFIFHFLEKHYCFNRGHDLKITCPHCDIVTNNIWRHLNQFHLDLCFLCGTKDSIEKNNHMVCANLIVDNFPIYVNYVIFHSP